MTNDPTLDGKYLGTISADFVKVADRLREASYLIRRQKDYTYPIFPISKVPISIGAILLEKGDVNNQWNYYAAYLDALVQCGLIAKEKVDVFRNTYKDPEEFCCLLVVDQYFTKILYIPYPEIE